MKSLDVVVLCKIFILQCEGKSNWSYAQLAKSVCLSVGETHASVKRLKSSRLFDDYTKSVIPSAMLEFLIHGVKYAFPADLGTKEIGIATAHAAPVFKDELVHLESDIYVWPYSKGSERGISVSPLSAGAPGASLQDVKIYDFLALLDGIRIGKAREQNISIRKLEEMVKRMNNNGEL
jgi:hypothetical protein